MKQQPDKMAAYYYRAAHINTDLNLDNQMYRLLHHAMTRGITAYTLYVDNGYSGLGFDRPAMKRMQIDMAQGVIGKIIVIDISRITRGTIDVLKFSEIAEKHGIEIETVDGENLCATLAQNRKFFEAMNGVYTAMKGGDCK